MTDAGLAVFRTETSATEQQIADLTDFAERLAQANAMMNLVGPSSLPEFWTRHALDSAQLLRLAPGARTWADLGAGAGFPGVVLAILLKGQPGTHVWLVDSLGKRCRFLQEVVEALALPATVINGRAEEQALKVDIVTARALAPLDRLLAYAQPTLSRGAQGLFLKGERAEEELLTARKSWHLKAELIPSRSDPRGRIIHVRSLSRVR